MTNAALIAQPEGEDPAKGIGTGPFILDSAQPGVRYNFKRNPKYFRPERPLFDELEILVINDDMARVSSLLAGSTHFASELTPNIVGRLKSSPSIKIDVAGTTTFNYFVMQTNKAPFDNPDLRLALKYAVDRNLILKTTQAGYGTIGNDNPINSIYPLYSELPQHTYDPDKASFYYKKSGHSGAIDLYVSESVFPGAVNAAELFQQSAAKAGITINPKRVPTDGYWSDIWMKKPFCASYFGSLATEDQAFTQPFASDSPWNDGNWYRPAFDRLLVQARSELDVEKRTTHTGYRSSMEIMEISKTPVIFTHSNPRALWDHERNLRDDQIKACARTGGVVGINGVSKYMAADEDCTPETIVNHIDYVANLVGVDHVGLGLDAVLDPDEMPNLVKEFPNVWPESEADQWDYSSWRFILPEQLPDIAEGLLLRQYSDSDIKKIMGQNFTRVAAAVWI
ncbi:membrane dipeptidase [Mesorhizobium sp. Cs1299R1N1]|uniref:ABC transporter substrate-binding protein n=1 Tax=Mesorhizobium sp. Cs1299R1N1 TaxID=3015172 RepID=UPI00301D70B4